MAKKYWRKATDDGKVALDGVLFLRDVANEQDDENQRDESDNEDEGVGEDLEQGEEVLVHGSDSFLISRSSVRIGPTFAEDRCTVDAGVGAKFSNCPYRASGCMVWPL